MRDLRASFRPMRPLALAAVLWMAACGRYTPPADACVVAAPGVTCGVAVRIDPHVPDGGPFGGFQSSPGTSYQSDIRITFSPPVQAVRVTILDPDYPRNELIAYRGDAVVASATFDGDDAPGVFTTSTETVRAGEIHVVVLRPDPLDYVAYRDLGFER